MPFALHIFIYSSTYSYWRSWSFVHEVAVQELVPDIRNTREAPVRAIRIAGWVRHLFLCQRGELFPEHRRVPVLTVVRQLGDIQYIDTYALLLQRPKI